jgi:hypothetical protein
MRNDPPISEVRCRVFHEASQDFDATVVPVGMVLCTSLMGRQDMQNQAATES